MDTYNGINVGRLEMYQPRRRRQWIEFLDKRGLSPVEGDTVAVLYDAADNLVGCATLAANVIQCVAVDESLEGSGLTNVLVSELRNEAFTRGVRNLRVFTKPCYRDIFGKLAFSCIAEAADAVLLESDPRALSTYTAYLKKTAGAVAAEGRRGAIVMNANPFTLGHLSLVEKAAGQVDHLFIIPVLEESSDGFSYEARRRMIERGVAHLSNVTVLQGSDYAVSRTTFPSYFIKDFDRFTDTHITLDLDIFARHIAPALGVDIRFVGTEPIDKVTERYNALMKELLPRRGIEVVEVRRLEHNGVISASRVRKAIAEGKSATALRLMPQATYPVMLAWLACDALRREVDCTPKPGLVDKANPGAHTDMDHALMTRSIRSLAPGFERISAIVMDSDGMPRTSELRRAGMEAEAEMLRATGGVNTHRGALFSMGLMVAAAALLLKHGYRLTEGNLQAAVVEMAWDFDRAEDTHGYRQRRRYGIRTALDEARSGYIKLFVSWLTYYRNIRNLELPLQRLLLKIMMELDDTNVYYRAGAEGASAMRRRAADVLAAVDIESLDRLNTEFVRMNISPGGAADMMALTLFVNGIVEPVIAPSAIGARNTRTAMYIPSNGNL